MRGQLGNTFAENFTPRIRNIIAIMIGSVGILSLIAVVLAPLHWQSYLIPLFCFLVVGACIARGKVSQFCGSCLGIYIFLLTCWYVSDEIISGPLLPARKGDQSLGGAILAVIAFGIPGLIYAWKAKFGFGHREKKKPA